MLNINKITNQELQVQSQKWLPNSILKLTLLPTPNLKSKWGGVLLLARDKPFDQKEIKLLQKCLEIYSHAFGAFHTVSLWDHFKNQIKLSFKKHKKYYYTSLLLLFLPISSTTIAPAEVIPEKPTLVRAAIDGVINQVYVEPGQEVKIGDSLVGFDQEALNTELQFATEEEKVAFAHLRQLMQESMHNQDARLQLATAQGKLEETRAKKHYILSQLNRSVIKATQDGIVMFDGAHDLIGRSMRTGEKLMLLARPSESILEVQLPIHQAMDMPNKASITFFSNTKPHLPKNAKLQYHSYRAHETSEGQMSYYLKAKWQSKNPDFRLGIKGNAKIYGYSHPIIWKIIKKPIYFIRKSLGW